jgi:hypothetical protein
MKQMLKKQKIGFTQINNKVLNDKNLSWKAKGVYCYIYSKTEDWQFSIKRIALDYSTGVEATTSAIKELEVSGYLKRVKKGDRRMLYYINYDKKPISGNPNLGKPQCGKTPTLSNKEFNSNKDKYIVKTSFTADKEKKAKYSSLNCKPKTKENKIKEKFNNDAEIKKLMSNKQKHLVIVGSYMHLRKMKFPSYKAFQHELKRNLKPASVLAEYPETTRRLALKKAMHRTREWTLETIIKYLHK